MLALKVKQTERFFLQCRTIRMSTAACSPSHIASLEARCGIVDGKMDGSAFHGHQLFSPHRTPGPEANGCALTFRASNHLIYRIHFTPGFS